MVRRRESPDGARMTRALGPLVLPLALDQFHHGVGNDVPDPGK